ncbi:MAG: hypothetical protein HYW05_00160 [Candidatus Diapherotrites archaeon]|nr:hypothetical protein [Candidatus Diapherotrites archaeon]
MKPIAKAIIRDAVIFFFLLALAIVFTEGMLGSAINLLPVLYLFYIAYRYKNIYGNYLNKEVEKENAAFGRIFSKEKEHEEPKSSSTYVLKPERWMPEIILGTGIFMLLVFSYIVMNFGSVNIENILDIVGFSLVFLFAALGLWVVYAALRWSLILELNGGEKKLTVKNYFISRLNPRHKGKSFALKNIGKIVLWLPPEVSGDALGYINFKLKIFAEGRIFLFRINACKPSELMPMVEHLRKNLKGRLKIELGKPAYGGLFYK